MLFAIPSVHLRAQTTSTGEFLLRAPAALINDIAARNNLIVVRQLPGQGLFVVTQGLPVAPLTNRTTSGDPTSQSTDIGSDPDIQSIEPNAVVSTPEVSLNGSLVSILDGVSGATTLTTYFDNQVWSRYVDQPATAAIGLAASQTAAGTGAGIVAVIDTGVDPHHPVLVGSLVPGYDFIHETAGIASEWSDVDGSVVSILDGSVVSILDGQAVTINGSVVAILDQATTAALDPLLLPHAFGHGTMVAGLVHLVAPTAQIMPLKAFHADGTSTVFDVVRAIYYAVDHGARVINMSFSSTSPSTEITRAINYATSHGVICVASAGNLGQETVVYPGGLRTVIGVGSTSSTTPPARSTFSNFGDALVSLGAPGEAIITTYPGAHFAAGWGTSFSAPLAAGGAALLLQVDPTVDSNRAAEMLGKAQPMAALGMGRGRLNLPDAVRGATDRIPPAVSFSSPTGGGTLFGSVSISASASDNVGVAGVRFLLDGNPLGSEATAAPFQQSWATTSAANGSHVLTAIARDRSGNETTTVVNVTVANDTAAPTVTLLYPQGGESLAGTVNVTATAVDDLEVAGVRFTVDGAPLGVEDTVAPYEAAWTTASVANGSHEVAAIARDNAGHETRTSALVTVVNDSAPPTAALTGPTAGATLTGTVPLTASVSDDVGVTSVTFLVDGVAAGAETPAGRFWNTTTAANGAHVVSVVARDAAGHQTTSSVDVTVRNDLAPTVALTTPVEGATLRGLVSVLATAADDIGVTGVQFKVDGTPVGSEDTEAPYEALWNTAAASNDSHTLSATARDAVGHETTISVTVVVANDSSPPTVAFTSPGSGETLTGAASILASATDNVGVASVEFLVDGVAAGAPRTSGPFGLSLDTEPLANGPHTVTAVARDAAGNETSASVTLTVENDHAAPTLTLVNPGGTVSGIVPLVATASDDIGVVSVEFLADGTIVGPAITAAPYEWDWNSAGVANGAHTIWALARDAAGHETLASMSVTVANDNAPPAVTLTNPVGAPTLSGTLMLAANASDDIGVVSVQFLVDGVAAGAPVTAAPYQASWNTASISNGPHTVSAVARDAAGHQTTASVFVTVANDTAAPTVALINPVNTTTVSGTVTLSATATDDVAVTSVQFLVDGVAAGAPITAQPYQWEWSTRQITGLHTVTAVARDAAGHESTTSAQVTVIEDPIPTP
ncbi:MAG TPA: Ig-like domain-containing protein [Vicinamibacterales bacterium]